MSFSGQLLVSLRSVLRHFDCIRNTLAILGLNTTAKSRRVAGEEYPKWYDSLWRK